MKRDEMDEIIVEVTARWPDAPEWPSETVARLAKDLRHFDASLVFAAVWSFVEAGQKRRPAPPQLYKRVAELAADQARFETPAIEANTRGRELTIRQWLRICWPDEPDIEFMEHAERWTDPQQRKAVEARLEAARG